VAKARPALEAARRVAPTVAKFQPFARREAIKRQALQGLPLDAYERHGTF
jgi:hypothetical protein